MTTSSIPLLILANISLEHREKIGAVYDVVYAPTPSERAAAVSIHGARFRALLTLGSIGLTEQELASMHALEIVCCLGAGYENIPMAALNERRIVVTNGAGTNDDSVADHAMALMLGVVRNIRNLDRQCRQSIWRDVIEKPPQLTGKRLGIFGLGTIGLKIARRAASFDMEIGYHNRQQKKDVSYTYFEDLGSLAHWCDVLLCATPGGADTRHQVDAAVLQALGPRGFLVNISRGSVIDTAALEESLRKGRIAAAGLDVYEGEPSRPETLIDLDNVILTPHMAGHSPEAMQASVDKFLANAEGHFSGSGAVSIISIG